MLTRNQATKLLRVVKFKGDPAPEQDHDLAAAPKGVRRALILGEGGEGGEERRSAAAIELQRCWRGFCVRCRLFEVLNTQASIQRLYTGSHTSSRDLGSQASSYQASIPTTTSFAQESLRKVCGEGGSRLKGYYQNYCDKTEEGGGTCIAFEEFCAHFIQSWWHRVQRRRRRRGGMEVVVSPTKSAASVTKSVSIILSPETGVVRGQEEMVGGPPPPHAADGSGQKGRSQKGRGRGQVMRRRATPLSPNEASSIIQQAWRRHIDVQVYRYYRDLINFRCRGNPAMMLRCINPKESTLLDAAAGVHIKFRLAGSKFPPNIYYKIFTHRTIIDMCANSPKDYTAAPSKRFAARDVHNRREAPPGSSEGGRDDKEGWYQRIENNGWRLVSDRLILRADQDPVTWESSRKKQDFQHSKLQRREEVEKKKKRKKVEWMKKMYKDGMLQARGDDPNMNTLVEDATEGMMAQLEAKGPEQVDDWEVDELLQWTSGLNFDDYQKSWQEIATSAGSETYIDERLHFKTSMQDPFEFSLMRNTLPFPPSPSPPSPSRVSTGNARTSPSKGGQKQGVIVN